MLAVGSLTILAVTHSVLGERLLIGPLVASQAFPKLPLPTRFAQRTLRFAWHLTSLSWLGLAWALMVEVGVRWPVAAVLASSGVIAHLFSKGHHFAWAVFLAGALGAASSARAATENGVAAFGVILLSAIGLLHVAWALGWKVGLGAAIPEVEGRPAFRPPVWLTLLVALGLFAFAAVLASLGGVIRELPLTRWAGAAAAAVFAARTVGDLRTVGLFKRPLRTAFAKWDSLLYTPISFVLCASFLWAW